MRTRQICLVAWLAVVLVLGGAVTAHSEGTTVKYVQPLPGLPDVVTEGVRWSNVLSLPIATPHLHIWLRCLQRSGDPADQITISMTNLSGDEMSAGSIVIANLDMDVWESHTFDLSVQPFAPGWSIAVRSSFKTGVDMPTVVLVGAMAVNNSVAPPTLPSLETVALSSLELEMASITGITLPPMLVIPVDLPLLPEQTQVVRLGGWGNRLKFDLRRPQPVDGAMADGTSFMEVLVNGISAMIIPDTSLGSTGCASFEIKPSKFSVNTPINLGFHSEITLRTPEENKTIFVLDNITIDYLALEDVNRSFLGLETFLFPLMTNGDFEAGLDGNWAVLPTEIAAGDVIKSTLWACEGGFAAIFEYFAGTPEPQFCASESVVSLPPMPAEDTWLAMPSTEADPVLQPVHITENLKRITWWGIWKDINGVACEPGPMPFAIATYSSPGATPTAIFHGIPADLVLSNNLYPLTDSTAMLHRYEILLPLDFAGDEFLSVQSVPGGCNFFWMSGSGSERAVNRAGALQSAPASLCVEIVPAVAENCFENASVSLPPNPPSEPSWDAYPSTTANPILQPLWFYQPIKRVRWWGIWKDSAGRACGPPTTAAFDIVSYAVPGETPLGRETVAVVPELVPGHLYPANESSAPLYRFEAALATEVFGDNYISVQSHSTGCGFYWITASDHNHAVDGSGTAKPAAVSMCVDLEPMEPQACQDNAVIGQPPLLPSDGDWQAVRSTIATPILQPINLYTNINSIRWWGIGKDSDGQGCTLTASPFKIVTYDTPGGTAVNTVTVTPVLTVDETVRYPLGETTTPLCRFEYTFTDDFVGSKYISIQQSVGACAFHWLSAGTGSYAVNSANISLHIPLSLCIETESSLVDSCTSADTVFAQPPMDPSYATLQPSTGESRLWEQINVADSVQYIEWWGVWLTSDGTACEPPSNPSFRIQYANSSSLDGAEMETVEGTLLRPFEEVFAFTLAGSGEEAVLYRYGFVADEILEVDNGWMSIHQISAGDECLFHWAPALMGAGSSQIWVGSGNSTALGQSMSLCLAAVPVPAISACTVSPAMIGSGQTGTLTLVGTDLRFIQELALIPEMPLPGVPGDATNPALFLLFDVNLLESTSNETITVDFRFNNPFNNAADGSVICTDGRARFAARFNETVIWESVASSGCDLLIDTVPPVLIVQGTEGLDANLPSSLPTVYASRVLPTGMPPSWAPANPNISTLKNPAGLMEMDMQVYANAGSVNDAPYTVAASPYAPLSITVNAKFLDPPPVDQAGNEYAVERSGFAETLSASTSPYVYPGLGTARWSGSAVNFLSSNAIFTTMDYMLEAQWNVEAEYDVPEPKRIRFRLEAQDMAGNMPDASRVNSINIHWIYRTRAKFTSQLDATAAIPEIFWKLDRPFPELPDAKPDCIPLAKFRLYQAGPLAAAPNIYQLTLLGQSDWRADQLRGTTRFFMLDGNTLPLQRIMDMELYRGSYMCLDIQGADETGNLQYHPGLSGTTTAALEGNEIKYLIWQNGSQRQDNLAVDTSLRVELYHERDGASGRYRNYGTATRVPLPPLAEACNTRVNGWAYLRANMPSADWSARGANLNEQRIIWKLYKEGALVARGAAPLQGSADGWVDFNLMDMLVNCDLVASAEDLNDFNADGSLVLESDRALTLGNFLAGPPASCFRANTRFDWRLGDEGNPPDSSNPNAPSARRREVRYTITAQTVVQYADAAGGVELVIDRSPATASFSIYVSEVEDLVRDEAPVREFGR